MRFRQILFWILALIALGWIAVGMSAGSQAAASGYNEAAGRTGYELGTTMGVSIVYIITLCTGIPAFLLFAFLAWRNGVGLREERRHRELLAAMQQEKRPQ